jgi:hypothetical protein
MSRPSATSTPRPPLPAPSPRSAFNEILIPRKHTTHAKRDPFFSITYALFSIPNLSHPSSFVSTAHPLLRTPGGSISISKKIFWLSSSACLTPMDAISSKNTPSNPFRIYFFRKHGGVPLHNFHQKNLAQTQELRGGLLCDRRLRGGGLRDGGFA